MSQDLAKAYQTSAFRLSKVLPTHACCIIKKLPDVSFVFSVLLHDISHHKTTCQKKSPKNIVEIFIVFQVLTSIVSCQCWTEVAYP